MKAIESFNEYIAYEKVIESRRRLYMNIFRQFEDMQPHLNEAQVIVDAGTFDDIFEYEVIDENVMSKLADKFKAATNTLKTKGKQALTDTQEAILKTGGKVAGVIKLMVDAVKKWLGEQFDLAKQAYDSAVGKKADVIKDKVEGMSDEKKNNLKKEVKNFKTILSAAGNWIKGGFMGDIAKAAQGSAKQEEAFIGYTFELGLTEQINEAIISGEFNIAEIVNEAEGGAKIPFVSAIAKGMNKIPPFSLLYKVKKGAAKIAGGVLDTFSYYATELAGAPGPYKFVALATLIGIVGEVMVKNAAKSALIAAIPGLGTAAYIVSKVAMGLAVVAAIEAVLGTSKEEKPEEA